MEGCNNIEYSLQHLCSPYGGAGQCSPLFTVNYSTSHVSILVTLALAVNKQPPRAASIGVYPYYCNASTTARVNKLMMSRTFNALKVTDDGVPVLARSEHKHDVLELRSSSIFEASQSNTSCLDLLTLSSR